MASLVINLLGPFQVTMIEPITNFETQKARALLAYLASELDQPHPREFLAEMLWPDRPEGASRANLRHTLGHLRAIIGEPPHSNKHHAAPPFLMVTRDAIRLNPEADFWVDTTAFLQLINIPSPEPKSFVDRFEEAVKLYRGAFLDDINLSDSAPFQEWVLLKREQFQSQMIQVLNRLARYYGISGEYDRALAHAWRQAKLTPWDEGAHQQIMRFLALTEQPGAALSHYESCREILAGELGVEPGVETIQLYEQIRDGKLEIPIQPRRLQPDYHPPGFLNEDAACVELPVFVAREGELAKLERLLKEMLKGQTCLAFVAGDAGQGKTALINKFASNAMETYPELLAATGNCSTFSGAGDPYRPFRDIMAMLTGDVEPRWLAGLMTRDHARRLWDAQSLAVKAAVTSDGSLIGPILSGEALLFRAAFADPVQIDLLERLQVLIRQKQTGEVEFEQNHLFDQYTNVLRIISDQHPLVLILDDMQWADNSSISLLFHLGRRLGGSRILIVCAYRPEEVELHRAGERHPLAKVLTEFKRIFGEAWIDLNRTERSEARRFVDAWLDIEPNRLTEEFRASLFNRSQGHPLFTIELLRAMQARRDLLIDSGGFLVESPTLDWALLPARVEAVIEERIGRLEPELQQILRIASIEGEIFTAQVVSDVQEIAERRLIGRLSQELERQHGLIIEYEEVQTHFGRMNRYKFNHILFRDYLYHHLSRGERRLLHGEVAVSLEKLYKEQLNEMAAQLAHHFLQAGDHKNAFPYFVQAAERATHLYANSEAIKHYSQAIEIAPMVAPDRAVLTNLHLGRGLAYETMGEFERSRADLETVLQMARAAGEKNVEWQTLLNLGKLWTSRDYQQSYDYFEQALKLTASIDDQTILAKSLNWMGNWYLNAEKPVTAIVYHQQALQIFEESGSRRDLANTLDLLGIASSLGGDSPTSLKFYDRAVALYRELDDCPSLASCLLGRGNLGSGTYISQMAVRTLTPSDARRDFEEALQISREIGSRADEAWALWSFGFLFIVQGDFGHSFEAAQECLRIASEIEHLEWLVAAQTVLGLWYVELLAPQEAIRQLEGALALAKELQSQHWIHLAAGMLASAYLLHGDLARAETCLNTVLPSQTLMDTLHKRYCWLRRAELALLQGNPALAIEIIDRLLTTVPGMLPEQVLTVLWKLKGDALAASGCTDEAQFMLRSALENAQASGEQYLLWRIHASLGKLYRMTGHHKESHNEFFCARRLIEDHSTTISEKALKENFLRMAYLTLHH